MKPVAAISILALGLAACSGGTKPQLDTEASSTSSAASAGAPSTAAPTTAALPTGPTTSLAPAPPELSKPQLTEQSTVTTAGIGPLTFGKTVAEAQRLLGTRLLTESGLAPAGECYFMRPELGPAGIFFLVTKSTIERVDIRAGGVKTRSGLGIGTTVEQLKAALKEQLQQQATTYTFVPTSANDANYRVVFETDGTKVTTFRSGQVPQVTNPSGC